MTPASNNVLATTKQARIAHLRSEIDSIHVANYQYWTQEEGQQSREARAEYQRRRERLEEIRRELLKM
jgi:hypothetical protein